MKLTVYGLVFACLYMGAFALPTNMEATKEAPPQENINGVTDKTAENEIVVKAEVIEKTKAPSEPSEEIKSVVETQAEPEMKTDSAGETKMTIEDKIDPEIQGKTLEALEATRENVPQPTKTLEALESTRENVPEPTKTLESPAKTSGTLEASPENTQFVPAKQSSHGKDWEGVDKHSDAWHDFDDKFLLLEHRYPDLTKEEFQEINHEDSIPLNFLKGFGLSELKEVDKALDRLDGAQKLANKALLQPETPIYITIPIVINSHSTLPISLSIGGTEVPLNMPHKEEVAPPAGQVNKLLSYTATPRRETNRHRSNLRTKIYARNKRHEVFQYERELE